MTFIIVLGTNHISNNYFSAITSMMIMVTENTSNWSKTLVPAIPMIHDDRQMEIWGKCVKSGLHRTCFIKPLCSATQPNLLFIL